MESRPITFSENFKRQRSFRPLSLQEREQSKAQRKKMLKRFCNGPPLAPPAASVLLLIRCNDQGAQQRAASQAAAR
jgi:hypothetical protein